MLRLYFKLFQEFFSSFDQKSTPTFTKFSIPFRKGHLLSVRDGHQFCHASAREYTAAATVQWLRNLDYIFISTWDWPANSPDLSPMDYSENGVFKRRLWRHAAWMGWNGPCARSGKKCLLISVWKRFLTGIPVCNLWFKVMAFRLTTWSNLFSSILSGEKKRHRNVAHALYTQKILLHRYLIDFWFNLELKSRVCSATYQSVKSLCRISTHTCCFRHNVPRTFKKM